MTSENTATERTARSRIGLCQECDYPLHSLPENCCPECGRAFDPRDPATMNMGKPIAPLVRWLLAPLRWWLVLLLSSPILLVLWGTTEPSYYYGPVLPFLLCVGIPVTAIPAAAALLLRAILQAAHDQPPFAADQKAYRALILIVLAVAVLIIAKVPLRLGFLTAKPQFERIRAAIDAGAPPATFVGTRAGIYRIDEVRINSSTLVIYTEKYSGGFGFASDGGTPRFTAPDGYGPVGSGWYWYSEE